MDEKNALAEKNDTHDMKLDYRMPIYLQLREIVRAKIEDGEYP